MKVNGHRYARPFDDEEEDGTDAGIEADSPIGGEPDYRFEGFSVEFLAKVQMLPVSSARPPKRTR
jgi:hypothetical protein